VLWKHGVSHLHFIWSTVLICGDKMCGYEWWKGDQRVNAVVTNLDGPKIGAAKL
jgi:hypothetical protein